MAGEEYFFELDLGAGNGGHLRFKSLEEANAWIESELKAWQWVEAGPVWKASEGAVQALRHLRNAQNMLRQDNQNAARNSLEDFKKLKLPRPESPIGKFILDFHKKDEKGNKGIAANMLAMHMKTLKPDDVSMESITAGIRLELYHHGVEGLEARASALDSLHSIWTGAFQDDQKHFDSLTSNGRSALDEIVETHGEHQKALGDALNDAKEKLQSYDDEYKERIKFQAPLAYWSLREKMHKKLATCWLWASGGMMVVAGVLLAVIVATSDTPPDVVQQLVKSTASAGITLDANAVDSAATRAWLSYIALKVLWVMFFFWPIRILVRNYLSNQHLAMDAGERRVVLETYLAMNTADEMKTDLIRQNGLIEALKVIFRHTQDGIVKDDAFPQPWWIPKQG